MRPSSRRRALGDYLRDLRRQAGYTREQVEAESRGGISASYVGLLERGERRDPAPQKLHVLASIYGVPLRDLLIAAQDEMLHRSVTAPVPSPPDNVTRLVRLFSRLSKSRQDMVLAQVDALVKQQGVADEDDDEGSATPHAQPAERNRFRPPSK